jgi:transcriptional regulator with GAF, ATPase, and Fis domain
LSPAGQRVAKAALLMMATIAVSRILGYGREVALYTMFGQNYMTDAYRAAFSLPDLLYLLLVGGALSSAFIPVFSAGLATGKEAQAWKSASIVFNYTMIGLVFLLIMAYSYTLPLIKLLAPGLPLEYLSQSKTLIEEFNRINNRVKQLEERIVNSEEISKEPFYTINPNTKKVLLQAKRVGATDATVLIQGESGTGKELMANVIYQNSKRSKQPFIAVNCSAIPSTLFESEMFGYEAGSFTGGSKSGKQGKFELANEGTIFLDEIGELPLDMQAKLLRVIQERKFYRVGGTAPVEVNVRLIAATNKDLARLVAEGKFREDLYYRLNVVTLEIPPLRERREDIIGLTQRFIKQMECVYLRSISGIDEKVLEMLQAYDWPGNVRQLHNLL